jgi:predicted porin
MRLLLLGLLSLASASAIAVPAGAQDRVDALLERLERQERELQALRQELQELRNQVPPPPEHPEYRREDGEDVLTEYVNPRVRLDVAGQVNPAVNIAGDGDDTKVYFVDNDSTASRIRFAGVTAFERGPDVGTTLEVGFSPNNSFDVSQDNEVASDFISVRRAEFWVLDERFGRFMLGRGSAAADNIAEFDLSLVGAPIMLSGVSFFAGGLQFTDGDDLTGVTIADAFFNFDGDRQSRVRYDTPTFGPLQLSVSAGADQRLDAAVTFGADFDHWTSYEGGGITTLGGVAVSDPSDDDTDYRVAGSWSALHNASGLSATFSAGLDGGTSGGTPYNLYGKLGWDARLVEIGATGFGVDYTWTENVSGDVAGDAGQSVGIAAVQVFQDYGIEGYTQFRWFSVDNEEGPSFEDVLIGTAGTRVRF